MSKAYTKSSSFSREQKEFEDKLLKLGQENLLSQYKNLLSAKACVRASYIPYDTDYLPLANELLDQILLMKKNIETLNTSIKVPDDFICDQEKLKATADKVYRDFVNLTDDVLQDSEKCSVEHLRLLNNTAKSTNDFLSSPSQTNANTLSNYSTDVKNNLTISSGRQFLHGFINLLSNIMMLTGFFMLFSLATAPAAPGLILSGGILKYFENNSYNEKTDLENAAFLNHDLNRLTKHSMFSTKAEPVPEGECVVLENTSLQPG